jgi:hypothetical protein
MVFQFQCGLTSKLNVVVSNIEIAVYVSFWNVEQVVFTQSSNNVIWRIVGSKDHHCFLLVEFQCRYERHAHEFCIPFLYINDVKNDGVLTQSFIGFLQTREACPETIRFHVLCF